MTSKKQRKVPELRFRGFTDDWEQRKLSQLLVERNDQHPENGEYPLMSFTGPDGVTPKSERYDRSALVTTTNKKYKRTELNDLIYSSNNLDTGSIGLNKTGKASISPVYSVFSETMLAVPSFVGVLILNKEFINNMIRYRQGVMYGQWRIHERDFLSIHVRVPVMQEQKHIGGFFSALDATIALHQRKQSLLKKLKQGYLQKLFPQKGQRQPELRFSGFTDDWEERKLGDVVGEIQSGNRLPKDSLTNGDVPYVVAQTKNDGVFKKIARGTLDYNGNPMKLFPGNSISFSIDNPEAMFYRNAEFYTSNIMRVIHEDHLTHEQYVFILENMKCFIRGYDWSRKFSGPVVSNLEYLQPSEEEQQKIGSFVKQLDDTIALHQQEINRLQKLKQGYLQKMFV